MPSKLDSTIFADGSSKEPNFLTTDGEILHYFIGEKNVRQFGTLKTRDIASAHIDSSSKSSLSTLIWVILSVLLGTLIYFGVDSPLVGLGAIIITSLAVLYFLYEHFKSDSGVSIVITTQTAEIKLRMGSESNYERFSEFVESLLVGMGEDQPTQNKFEERIFSPR